MRKTMIVLVGSMLVMGGVAGPPHSEAADSCSLTGTYNLSGLGEAAGFLGLIGDLVFTPNAPCTGGTVGGSVTIGRQNQAASTAPVSGTYAVTSGGVVTVAVPGVISLTGLGSLTGGGVFNVVHFVVTLDPPQPQSLSVTATRNPPAGLSTVLGWSQILPAATRFQLVMGGAAVLDNETGLVWEQSPETAPNPTTPQSWLSAQASCNGRAVGGRKGWRLPTIQELASLVDPTQVNPALPSGHPFGHVQLSFYWSATTTGDSTATAWGVLITGGAVDFGGKAVANHVWCVRAGQGVDPQ